MLQYHKSTGYRLPIKILSTIVATAFLLLNVSESLALPSYTPSSNNNNLRNVRKVETESGKTLTEYFSTANPTVSSPPSIESEKTAEQPQKLPQQPSQPPQQSSMTSRIAKSPDMRGQTAIPTITAIAAIIITLFAIITIRAIGLADLPMSNIFSIDAAFPTETISLLASSIGIGAITGSKKSDRSIAHLTRQLMMGTVQTRQDAARELGELKAKEAIEPLLAMLYETDWRLRATAAGALGDIGDETAVRPLTKLALQDPEVKVRQFAANALGKIGGAEAIKTLTECLSDTSSLVHKTAAAGLVKIGKDSVPSLLYALEDKKRDTWTRLRVVHTLGEICNLKNIEYYYNAVVEAFEKYCKQDLKTKPESVFMEELATLIQGKAEGNLERMPFKVISTMGWTSCLVLKFSLDDIPFIIMYDLHTTKTKLISEADFLALAAERIESQKIPEKGLIGAWTGAERKRAEGILARFAEAYSKRLGTDIKPVVSFISSSKPSLYTVTTRVEAGREYLHLGINMQQWSYEEFLLAANSAIPYMFAKALRFPQIEPDRSKYKFPELEITQDQIKVSREGAFNTGGFFGLEDITYHLQKVQDDSLASILANIYVDRSVSLSAQEKERTELTLETEANARRFQYYYKERAEDLEAAIEAGSLDLSETLSYIARFEAQCIESYYVSRKAQETLLELNGDFHELAMKAVESSGLPRAKQEACLAAYNQLVLAFRYAIMCTQVELPCKSKVPFASAPDFKETALSAAREIIILLLQKPNAVIGLATGSTMPSVYDALARYINDFDIDLSTRPTFFNLDEYHYDQPDIANPKIYRNFMRQNFFDKIKNPGHRPQLVETSYKNGRVHATAGNAYLPEAPKSAAGMPVLCRWYDEQIAAKGGIDLQLVGIGRGEYQKDKTGKFFERDKQGRRKFLRIGGHIGFNEPLDTELNIPEIKYQEVLRLALFAVAKVHPEFKNRIKGLRFPPKDAKDAKYDKEIFYPLLCAGISKTLLNSPTVKEEFAAIQRRYGLKSAEPIKEMVVFFSSPTKKVRLTTTTRLANKEDFAGMEEARYAVSMGLGSILRAKKIILLGQGDEKADVVGAGADGNITPYIPATILQMHPNVKFMLDDLAGVHLLENPHRFTAEEWITHILVELSLKKRKPVEKLTTEEIMTDKRIARYLEEANMTPEEAKKHASKILEGKIVTNLPKNTLVIATQPHPDDIPICVAGQMALLAGKGTREPMNNDIRLFTATNGYTAVWDCDQWMEFRGMRVRGDLIKQLLDRLWKFEREKGIKPFTGPDEFRDEFRDDAHLLSDEDIRPLWGERVDRDKDGKISPIQFTIKNLEKKSGTKMSETERQELEGLIRKLNQEMTQRPPTYAELVRLRYNYWHGLKAKIRIVEDVESAALVGIPATNVKNLDLPFYHTLIEGVKDQATRKDLDIIKRELLATFLKSGCLFENEEERTAAIKAKLSENDTNNLNPEELDIAVKVLDYIYGGRTNEEIFERITDELKREAKTISKERFRAMLEAIRKTPNLMEPILFYISDDADPMGTHGNVQRSLRKSMDKLLGEYKLLKPVAFVHYHGAWGEYPMAYDLAKIVTFDVDINAIKQKAIKAHWSQDPPKFPGDDPRPFYSRAFDRNKAAADTLNRTLSKKGAGRRRFAEVIKVLVVTPSEQNFVQPPPATLKGLVYSDISAEKPARKVTQKRPSAMSVFAAIPMVPIFDSSYTGVAIAATVLISAFVFTQRARIISYIQSHGGWFDGLAKRPPASETPTQILPGLQLHKLQNALIWTGLISILLLSTTNYIDALLGLGLGSTLLILGTTIGIEPLSVSLHTLQPLPHTRNIHETLRPQEITILAAEKGLHQQIQALETKLKEISSVASRDEVRSIVGRLLALRNEQHDVTASKKRFIELGWPSRHNHTNAEWDDGDLTPKGLVDYALNKGITSLIVCGHNCVGGSLEAAEYARSLDHIIEVLPALEMACAIDKGGGDLAVLDWKVIFPGDLMTKENWQTVQEFVKDLNTKFNKVVSSVYDDMVSLGANQAEFDRVSGYDPTSKKFTNPAIMANLKTYIDKGMFGPEHTDVEVREGLLKLLRRFHAFSTLPQAQQKKHKPATWLTFTDVVGGWTSKTTPKICETSDERRALRIFMKTVFNPRAAQAKTGQRVVRIEEAAKKLSEMGALIYAAHPLREVEEGQISSDELSRKMCDLAQAGLVHGISIRYSKYSREDDEASDKIWRDVFEKTGVVLLADGSNPDFHRKGAEDQHIKLGSLETDPDTGEKYWTLARPDGESLFRDLDFLAQPHIERAKGLIRNGELWAALDTLNKILAFNPYNTQCQDMVKDIYQKIATKAPGFLYLAGTRRQRCESENLEMGSYPVPDPYGPATVSLRYLISGSELPGAYTKLLNSDPIKYAKLLTALAAGKEVTNKDILDLAKLASTKIEKGKEMPKIEEEACLKVILNGIAGLAQAMVAKVEGREEKTIKVIIFGGVAEGGGEFFRKELQKAVNNIPKGNKQIDIVFSEMGDKRAIIGAVEHTISLFGPSLPDKKYALGVDYGGTHIRVGLVNLKTMELEGEPEILASLPDEETREMERLKSIIKLNSDEIKKKTPDGKLLYENLPSGLENFLPDKSDRKKHQHLANIFLSRLETLIRRFDLELNDVGWISLASPGVFKDETDGPIKVVHNLPLTGVDIRRRLREEFSMPAHIGNDVVCAAVGELTSGAGKGQDVVFALTVATGLNMCRAERVKGLTAQEAQAQFAQRVPSQRDLVDTVAKLASEDKNIINNKKRKIVFIDDSLPPTLMEMFISQMRAFIDERGLSNAIGVDSCHLDEIPEDKDTEVLCIMAQDTYRENRDHPNVKRVRVLSIEKIVDLSPNDDLTSVLPPDIAALSLGLVCTNPEDINVANIDPTNIAARTRELYSNAIGSEITLDNIAVIVNKNHTVVFEEDGKLLKILTIRPVKISDTLDKSIRLLEEVWSQV